MTDAEPSPLICGDPQASVAVAPRLVGTCPVWG